MTVAEVSMPDKAEVVFDKDKVTVAQLIKAIKDAGYSASQKKPK